MKLPHIDWDQAIKVAGFLVTLLGVNHTVDQLKKKAADWKKAVLAKARAVAHEVAGQVKRGSIAAERGLLVFERQVEAWVEQQGKKLPASMRGPLLEVAESVFHEVHVYTDPIGTELKHMDELIDHFRRELERQAPNLKRIGAE